MICPRLRQKARNVDFAIWEIVVLVYCSLGVLVNLTLGIVVDDPIDSIANALLMMFIMGLVLVF